MGVRFGTKLGTTLGTKLGTDLGGGTSGPPPDPIITLAPHTLLRASTGFSAGTWTDIMAGRTFTPDAVAPTVTTASELGGATVLRFNGTSQRLTSTAPPATWKFGHDGTGMELYVVCVPRKTAGPTGSAIVGTTQNYNATQIGFTRANQSSSDFSIYGVMNGVNRIYDSQSANYYHLNVPCIAGCSYKELSSPECRHVVDMFLTTSGATAVAPSASDPPFTLSIGAYATGGTTFSQVDIAEIMIFNRELTAGERAIIQAYCVSTYPGVIDNRLPRWGALGSGFTAGNYLGTGTPGGEAGTATGFGGCVLIRYDALNAAGRYLISRIGTAPNAGYEVQVTANVVRALFCDGAATFAATPTYTYVANDVGKWDLVVFQNEGALVKLYRARGIVGTSTAIAGYTAATSRTTLGCRSTDISSPATGITIAGAMTWTGTPTALANIQALFDYVKANGDFPNTVTGTTVTHLWSVFRDQVGGVMPGTLIDYAGSDNMTVTGTLSATPGANDPWCY